MLIKANDFHTPVDVSEIARNWRPTASGAQARAGNKAAALRSLTYGLNRCLARYPRCWAWMSSPVNSINTHRADTVGAAPLYNWRVTDNVFNANRFTVRVVATARVTSNGDTNSYLAWGQGSSDEHTGVKTANVSSFNMSEDLYHEWFHVNRGSAAAASVERTVNTYYGMPVLDVVVQDWDYRALRDDTQRVVHCETAWAGRSVLTDVASNIRMALHDLRINNLPIDGCWSAQSNAGAWANTSTTSDLGCVVTNVSYVNLLDSTHNVVSRDSNTPGISCAGYLSGRGLESSPQGRRSRVACYVRAHSNGINAALCSWVNFQGSVDSAALEIPLNHATINWYGPAYVSLNTARWYAPGGKGLLSGGERNKIDLFGKVGTAGDELRIYGVSLERSYN